MMIRRRAALLCSGWLAVVASLFATTVAYSGGNEVNFAITDNPGRWFDTGVSIAGTRSLGVATPGVRVNFSGRSNTVHTRTSLIYPAGAVGMPFNTPPRKGSDSVTLTTPGLYVFTCSIHPYMFGAVIVDDPNTSGLDLGASISLVNGITVPSSSDLATRLLRTFFIATNPGNWQNYVSGAPWHVTYPNVDVRVDIGVVNLPTVLNARYGNDTALQAPFNPSVAGVGQVWVDTQFELTSGKSKPGTATAVSATTWQPTRKVALPSINMNNPHNMWTDRNQTLIYQTQWFDSKLTVFNRETGALVRNISVGESPAHVMTRVDTDQLHVTNNGDTRTDSVMELAPLGTGVERRVNIGRGNPHAHWMSHDGQKMVTPNVITGDTTQFDFGANAIESILPTSSPLSHPIATGMMPDASKYYVANLLDSTISVIDMHTHAVVKTINLIANYDPLSGAISTDGNGNLLPVGALPIQTPVSPNGKNMVTANTLTGTITVVDTRPNVATTDMVVAMLACDPGCHGVQYGAKAGGGYYAYVSSKFSNALLVVDPDPNGDGNPADARIVGRIGLTATGATAKDANITGNPGMGGQGILTIPVVYNGWVQNLPPSWKNQLTPEQQNPIP
jgi:YVTN family beta-propeller protein